MPGSLLAPRPAGLSIGGKGRLRLASDMLAYWPLAGASAIDLTDHSGRVNTLTATGSPTRTTGPTSVPGVLAWAATTTELATSADVPALSLRQGQWSFGVWAYLADITAQHAVFGKYLATGNQRGWALDYNNSTGFFEFRYSTDGASGTVAVKAFPTTISATTWYCLIARYAGGTLHLSTNNSVDSTSSLASWFNAVTPFVIGNNGAGFGTAAGRVANAAFWPFYITDAEKTAFYNGGAGLVLA